jgi:hypothetical protein
VKAEWIRHGTSCSIRDFHRLTSRVPSDNRPGNTAKVPARAPRRLLRCSPRVALSGIDVEHRREGSRTFSFAASRCTAGLDVYPPSWLAALSALQSAPNGQSLSVDLAWSVFVFANISICSTPKASFCDGVSSNFRYFLLFASPNTVSLSH